MSASDTWIMHGIDEKDPRCLHSAEELTLLVEKLGFLPLFRNEIQGFSVEELTNPHAWWTGDAERDPWEWRKAVAEGRRVAYGKFFNRKAGFVSLDWLPVLANWRRDGYDFDARWEDAKAPRRHKKIMELFDEHKELFSYEIKQLAGFGTEGERNFEGSISELQMQTYLVVSDFRQRLNKQGMPYGWSIALYSTPEILWGYDLISACYEEEPAASYECIAARIAAIAPKAGEAQIRKLIK